MSDFLKNIGESIGINKSHDLDSLKNIQRTFPNILNTRVLMLLTFLTGDPLSSIAQNDSLEKEKKVKRVDSVENIVNNTSKENKLKAYTNLIEEAWKLSPDTAIQYIHEMLSFAKKNEDKQSEAKAYDYLGKYDAYYVIRGEPVLFYDSLQQLGSGEQNGLFGVLRDLCRSSDTAHGQALDPHLPNMSRY